VIVAGINHYQLGWRRRLFQHPGNRQTQCVEAIARGNDNGISHWIGSAGKIVLPCVLRLGFNCLLDGRRY
jgi:hypothetical protein